MVTHNGDSGHRHIDVDQAMAMIEKAQHLGGYFPDAEALDRARRILEGTLTRAQARAEISVKYGLPLPKRE